MAAALVQPAFSSLTSQIQSDEILSSGGLASNDTTSPNQDSDQDKNESDSVSLNNIADDNESDDEILVNVKKSKKGRKAVKVLSDESSDENDNASVDLKENDDFSKQNNSTDCNLNAVALEKKESDDEDIGLSGKESTKIRKLIKANSESDSEIIATQQKVDKRHKSRRREKDELEKQSKRGSAMKKLMKSRAKKKLKTFDKSGGEEPSNSVNDSSSDGHESDSENILKVQKKAKKKSKSSTAKEGASTAEEVPSVENDDEDSNMYQEFSDSSDEEEDTTSIKRDYTTRGKAVVEEMDYVDDEEKKQQEKTEKILEDKDLFDAGSEDSDSANSKEPDTNRGHIKKQKKKSERPKKMTKSEILEMKSNQQKLLRNNRIRLPEHRPTDISIEKFLQRIPVLKSARDNQRMGRSIKEEESQPKADKDKPLKAIPVTGSLAMKKLKSLASVPFPKLSTKAADLEFELEDESPTAPGLTSLMQRLEKHTGIPKQKVADSKREPSTDDVETDLQADGSAKKSIINLERIEKAADTPGSRLQELKSQLQKGMKAVREENRKEAEMRKKLENEDFDDEEEWEVEEEETDEEDAEGGSKNPTREEDDVKKDGVEKYESGSEAEDENDDELKKWNEDDARKQIETQLEAHEEAEKEPQNTADGKSSLSKFPNFFDESTATSVRTVSSSVDLFHGIHEEDNSESSLNLELKGAFRWDDTSTIPPGQGDSVRDSNKGRLEVSTPFSKLLNSSRRYSSMSDDLQKMSSEDENDVSRASHKDRTSKDPHDDSSRACPVISDDLHFALDENTQFSQILDSQGYFQPRNGAKAKKQPQAGAKTVSSSMSQLLGLCSGDFGAAKTKESALVQDDFGLPSDLPSDLPLDAPQDNASSQDFLDLCTGKFTDPNGKDKSIPSGKKDSVLSRLLGQTVETHASESQVMLDLCSGTFANAVDQKTIDVFEESKSTGSLMRHFGEEKVDSDARKSFNNLFSDKRDNECTTKKSFSLEDERGIDDGSIGEDLLGLCTGKFCEDSIAQQDSFAPEQETHSASKKAKICESEKLESGEVGDNSVPESLLSHENDQGDVDDNDQAREEDSDGEDQPEAVEEEDEEVDEELQEYNESLPRKKFTKKQFYEVEAELSGSDASEDEDLGSEADEYEIDSDVENLPSNSKIKAQVQKAHMKATLEDDRQDIRLFQERFFEDGDLISDGLGRRRNFRWRNIDRPMNNAAESDGSGAEEENENDDVGKKETEKRIQRLEREAFLEEQRKSQEDVILDENSQSILSIIKEKHSKPDTSEAPKCQSQTGKSVCFKRQGSFLDRNKATLSRLSSFTSNHSKTSAPARSFVFQAKSTNNTPQASGSSKAIRRQLSDSEPPHPKKAKMDRTLSIPLSSSIFNHL